MPSQPTFGSPNQLGPIVSATQLQQRDVANTAPSNNQALVWNSGASQWQPGSTATSGYTAVSDYRFGAQTPGGTLTASVPATVTLTPVPPGVNGADTNHYLYVSAGTGAAEAVLITGGTAVAGNASGTITFTPANNHSGAWTIQSATAGIQEAVIAAIAAGSYRSVFISPGTYTIFGQTHLQGASNIALWAIPNTVTLDFRPTLDSQYCIYNTGAFGNTTKVAANVNGGGGTLLNDHGRAFYSTNVFTVSSATGLAANGFLTLGYNDNFKAGGIAQVFWQTAKIKSVVGTTVTTYDRIVIPLNTAGVPAGTSPFNGSSTDNVIAFTPVTNNTISGINFDGTNNVALLSQFVGLYLYADSVVDHVKIGNLQPAVKCNFGLGSSIGYNNKWSNITSENVVAQGSSIYLWRESYLQAENWFSLRDSFGPELVYPVHGTFNNIISIQSIGRGFKSQGAVYCSYSNINSSNCTNGTGMGLQGGSYRNLVNNIVCCGNFLNGFYFSGEGNIYNTVNNAQFMNNGNGVDYNIAAAFGYTDDFNVVRNVNAEQPYVGAGVGTASFTAMGAMIPRAEAQDVTGIAISNNTWTAMPFSNNVRDSYGTIHSVSVNPTRFTVPLGEAGIYNCKCVISYPASATGVRGIQPAIKGVAQQYTVTVPGSASVSADVMFSWDLDLQPDAAKTITNIVNNGSGLCRLTIAGHGYTSNDYVFINADATGVPNARGYYLITVIDANTFDLVGSVFAGTYVSAGSSVRYPWVEFQTYQNSGGSLTTNVNLSYAQIMRVA